MTMEYKYNMKSPAVKRLMREARELNEPSEEYYAQPVEDNLFEWHFTVRGPPDSDFDGGIYHGRIILPPEYPMKPPSIILLTPNGRFEINKKICLSISGHHPESWQPSWSIRTALLAIIGFMPTQGLGAIGSLDYTPDERKALAQRSHDWRCPVCGPISNSLLYPQNVPRQVNEEARDLASKISFKGEGERAENPQDVSYVNDTSSNQPWQLSENPENEENEIGSHTVLHDRLTAAQEINKFDDSLDDNARLYRRRQHQTSPNEANFQHNVTVTNSNFNCNGSTIAVFVLVIAIIGLLLRRIFVL